MITFILAFTLARVLCGRGLFPNTKSACIFLMALSIGAYTDSWLVFFLSLLNVSLLVKPGAGNRYMAFMGVDVRDYSENKWVCLLADKIIRTHPGDQLTKREARLWGAVYASIQGLACVVLLFPIGNCWIGLLGLLRGLCWYVMKSLPHKDVYGGMAADALEGLLFALIVVLAYEQA